MKSLFSTAWLSSKQPRKQRKFRANAPLHIKHKFLNASLAKPLKEKHGQRTLAIRKGDEVKVLRGSFAKKEGKVILVQPKRTRVAVEGLQRAKKDGTKVNVWFHPSTLQLTTIDLDDKKRLASLNKVPSAETKKTSEKKDTKNVKKEKPTPKKETKK
ncbi:50S ribosomal protein L24 [Candidatus Pacearchaeota archaeon]|jgi:large subunit ribosomal protein L24|nr:50S ribosomal protein L24 [Candidatus Pacearchaeota archaeon]|tara:strand:- start:192 stop:662 length:471 start_codon:yes stop_codon:yes gene_type:complete